MLKKLNMLVFNHLIFVNCIVVVLNLRTCSNCFELGIFVGQNSLKNQEIDSQPNSTKLLVEEAQPFEPNQTFFPTSLRTKLYSNQSKPWFGRPINQGNFVPFEDFWIFGTWEGCPDHWPHPRLICIKGQFWEVRLDLENNPSKLNEISIKTRALVPI